MKVYKNTPYPHCKYSATSPARGEVSDLLYYKKVTHNDKPLVEKWLSEKHVMEFFYGEGLHNTLNNLALYCQGINDNGRYSFDQWIGFYDGIPFAFLITSTVTGPHDPNNPYDKWYVDGKETCTLDVLIGAKEFLGKGLSTVMIKQFILKQFPKTDYFIIDPELKNGKAIHVYEKVGFQKTEVFTPEYNRAQHQMMRLRVKDLING